jgi:diguanylate cyclase (GGDEF)-like protein
MPVTPASRRVHGWLFNIAICLVGVVIATVAAVLAVSDTDTVPALMCVGGLLLTVIVGRFPIVFDPGDGGGVQIAFDSGVLMFMVCTLNTSDALVVWSLGVVATQLITDRRAAAKVFNVGVQIVAGALAALIVTTVRGDGAGTARELAGVAIAATAYFATDLLLSAVSVTIEGRGAFGQQLLQPKSLLAVACFVPFDTLGYLAAVVYRVTPWWTLTLLCVPLVTLLVATRAVTRGQENARRLSSLFEAAVRAQTLTTRADVEQALIGDARRLLRQTNVTVRSTPPGRGEIGAQVDGGGTARWVVARSLDRAVSTSGADEQALKALAAVAAEALYRLGLTDEMVHVARHDPLTDLPNRGILLDRVTEALRTTGEQPVALLFIDLDGFKPVNDRFGHEAGDAVLVQLADRLRTCVGDVGTVARLGGDEFAVLLENLPAHDVEAMCNRVIAAIREDLCVEGHAFSIGASAGIAFAVAGDTAAGLVRKADLAMYTSKLAGKGEIEEYDEAMGRSRLERLEMVDDLRGAVAGGEIQVAYQPIVAVDTGRIIGAEALARWTRDGVAVPPDVFIPAAEDAGLIVALGEQVLAKVAADAAALRESVDEPFRMTVNISARQLRDPAFVDRVRDAVEQMAGITLVLELTERQGIDLDPHVLARMEGICAAGAQLAIDDFGVGFSSISYLHDLPVHYIKADASLAEDIDIDDRARGLLRSVMAMGRTLGFGVIIEGIERETQFSALGEDAGDLCAQGFLMYRPMPAGDLLSAIAADRAAGEPQVPAPRRWEGVAAAVEATA